MERLAVLAGNGDFRYWLSRYWDRLLPNACIVMLNPSTADHKVDDATIRKLTAMAKHQGYGGFEVVNLFAFRATDPSELKARGWPVGADNDDFIQRAAKACSITICAWGTNAKGTTRPREVYSLLQRMDVSPFAFRVSKDGHPCHPLYLPTETTPKPWALA